MTITLYKRKLGEFISREIYFAVEVPIVRSCLHNCTTITKLASPIDLKPTQHADDMLGRKFLLLFVYLLNCSP